MIVMRDCNPHRERMAVMPGVTFITLCFYPKPTQSAHGCDAGSLTLLLEFTAANLVLGALNNNYLSLSLRELIECNAACCQLVHCNGEHRKGGDSLCIPFINYHVRSKGEA